MSNAKSTFDSAVKSIIESKEDGVWTLDEIAAALIAQGFSWQLGRLTELTKDMLSQVPGLLCQDGLYCLGEAKDSPLSEGALCEIASALEATAKEWVSEGLSADGAAAWIGAGCCSPAAASHLTPIGVAQILGPASIELRP